MDISHNKWSEGPTLMQGRSEHSCAAFKEKRLAVRTFLIVSLDLLVMQKDNTVFAKWS